MQWHLLLLKSLGLVKEQKFYLQLILGVTAVVVILVLPFVFFPYNRLRAPFASDRFSYSYLFSAVYLMPFYFVHRYYLIDKLLANKKILYYLAAVFIFNFLYMYGIYLISVNAAETKELLNSKYASTPYYIYKGPKLFSTGPLTIFLLVFVISGGSTIVSRWFTAEEKQKAISQQQIETELHLLKSQVNPHFLFNTLNSIYSLALTGNARTADSVFKLSTIMRYTLEESQTNFVPLQNELKFINSYIDLQKMRLNQVAKVQFTQNIEQEDALVAPLLLIPFIENAFKYGISTHTACEVVMRLEQKNNQLYFTCTNQVFKNQRVASTGTGLQNVKRRLELLYPQKHTLTITENHLFTIQLHIEL